MSIAVGKTFPLAYARNLRREIDIHEVGNSADEQTGPANRQYAFAAHQEKALQRALLIFESEYVSQEDPYLNSFEFRAKQYLRRNLQYATPNHRRGMLDQDCQSKCLLIRSASELRARAEKGDGHAVITIVAFCAGLNCELVQKIPLHEKVQEDWFMTLDVGAGLIRTNIDPIYPESATPSLETVRNYRPACKIVTKPLPRFLSALLQKRLENNPTGRKLGDLFANVFVGGRDPTLLLISTGIAPSVRRFLNSPGLHAVNIGINRLAAAAITNDFSICPGAKFFYAQIEREEIWEASSKFFGSLNFGEPVDFQVGLAVGALVVPTHEAVAKLFSWMEKEVLESVPGKRYSYRTLIHHHNNFAKYCAAYFSLCVGSRETKILGADLSAVLNGSAYMALHDKITGQFSGALPVPINKFLREVVKSWAAHCIAIIQRLIKLEKNPKSKLPTNIVHLAKSIRGNQLFLVSEKNQLALFGTEELVNWCPAHLRLVGNYGRSFWQVEFHRFGLKSSIIDIFMRHQLMGKESYSSTSELILHDSLVEICRVQEQVLADLKINPLRGLAK